MHTVLSKVSYFYCPSLLIFYRPGLHLNYAICRVTYDFVLFGCLDICYSVGIATPKTKLPSLTTQKIPCITVVNDTKLKKASTEVSLAEEYI